MTKHSDEPDQSGQKTEMTSEELFLSRIQLLVVMAKAFLKGYPLGKFRRRAILENSEAVFYTSMQLRHEMSVVNGPSGGNQMDEAPEITLKKTGEFSPSHLLHQRIQLLAVMARAIAEGRLEGDYKRRALSENVEAICAEITFKGALSDATFLKVA